MIDIYGKEMYNLSHEDTRQTKKELSLYKSAEVGKGSGTTLYRTKQDRIRKDEAYCARGNKDCQVLAFTSRHIVGRGKGGYVTYPLYPSDKNRLSHLTHPLHNIPYATSPLISRGSHQDNTSCNFHVFSCLKKGGINNCLATALIPHIKYQERYRTC